MSTFRLIYLSPRYRTIDPNSLKRVGCMTWFVQYKQLGTDQLVQTASPEQAIETACHLLDDGCDVYGIGTGPVTNSIDKEQITRIYDMWARAHPNNPRGSEPRN